MPKKVTQEEFIRRATKVHGDKYDLSLLTFKNFKEKVEIYCNVCNRTFKQWPDALLKGYGCCFCSMKKRRDSLENLSGQKFGRLTVIKFSGNTDKNQQRVWECLCECGTIKLATTNTLKSGNIKSCGCLQRENFIGVDHSKTKHFHPTTHNMSNSQEYGIWAGMIQRCYNSKIAPYKHYGGRGIYVCRRWKKSFEKFYKDMGSRPTSKHSIDRIDNNGPYAPWNCRWATWNEQSNNKRSNHLLYCWGMSYTMKEWAKRVNINYKTLNSRINQYKWEIGRALTQHPDKYHNKGEYAKK